MNSQQSTQDLRDFELSVQEFEKLQKELREQFPEAFSSKTDAELTTTDMSVRAYVRAVQLLINHGLDLACRHNSHYQT